MSGHDGIGVIDAGVVCDKGLCHAGIDVGHRHGDPWNQGPRGIGHAAADITRVRALRQAGCTRKNHQKGQNPQCRSFHMQSPEPVSPTASLSR